MRTRGFTLIELMIVVAIIAIIAAIAIPSLLRSRIAANEVAAVAACKSFAEAEEIYRRSDYDHDGLLEYAQHLRGNNSLLETSSGAGDLSLIDKTFGMAEGATLTAVPKAGYIFTVLLSQGPTGGMVNYVNAAGNMMHGYALGAVPASYDGTGRNRFIINGAATVYQRDIPNSTHELIYDPNVNWTPSE
jgi:prepilin-type N-terminal cleavage/methylation domain-containing protein